MGTHMNKPATGITAAITAAVLATGAIGASIAAAANASEVEDLRAQVTALATERDQYAESLEAQTEYDTDMIADLQAQLADVTGQRDDLAADLQQTVNDRDQARERVHDVAAERDQAVANREAHTTSDDPLDVARGKAQTSTWEGFTVGEVILCPKGWVAADDDAEAGMTWAACM